MRYIGWLVAGFVLYRISGALEAMGDAAPFVPEGVSGERLQYHGAALAALIAGAGCFVRGAYLAWREFTGHGRTRRSEAKTAEAADEPEFDPDAALARYLQSKGEEPVVRGDPGSFGRKGL